MNTSCAASRILAVAVVTLSSVAHADWLTLPGQFSHDPMNGERIAQYSSVTQPTAPVASNFLSSGYTHYRSSINFGQSADNYHRVQQWGAPVRPYGEWRFPYRPYSVPYAAWGAPFAGLNLGPQFINPGGVPGVAPGPGAGAGAGAGAAVPGAGFGPGYGAVPGYGFPPPGVPFPNGGGGDSLRPYPLYRGSPHVDPPYFDGHHPVYRD